MSKYTIKVVKRKDISDNPPLVDTPLSAGDSHKKMVTLINGWIQERSDNDGAEKASSAAALEDWTTP